ncbi:hypothetical protein PsorP6_019317 [Peronosclerospora sorghi]|nr:hypothetical protein PsorP6_019317 [Peronosclerospora sorghi]
MLNRKNTVVDNSSKIKDMTARVVNFADISSLVSLARDKKRGLRELLNASQYKLVFSAQNYTSDVKPPSSKGTGFMVETSSGRRIVSPEEFVEAATLLQPNMIVPLADESSIEKGRHRHRMAVQTSLHWLDACQVLNSSRMPMCGVVVGGNDPNLRQVSVTETCKRDIQAIFLSGLEACGDGGKRLELIDAIVGAVTPKSLVRIISGIGNPLDVIDTVNRGVDVFVSSYPATATKAGDALIFWISEDDDGSRASERNSERECFGGVMHLKEKRFATDFRPILVECGCVTCQKYTRAYIHHLLNVREMLGDILLYLHNLQHFYRFFQEIRAAINMNAFVAFSTAFTSRFNEKIAIGGEGRPED